MYILMNDSSWCQGIFSSLETLRKGVDYAVKDWSRDPKFEHLAWYECDVDDETGPHTWDWAYISPNAKAEKLASGGGHVPMKKYWGMNLINIKWESMPEYE
jgi:hypothetical protein